MYLPYGLICSGLLSASGLLTSLVFGGGSVFLGFGGSVRAEADGILSKARKQRRGMKYRGRMVRSTKPNAGGGFKSQLVSPRSGAHLHTTPGPAVIVLPPLPG